MTRLGSLVLCTTLGMGVMACGGGGDSSTTSKTALDLVPLGNDVSGWTVDEAHNQSPGQRAMVGNSQTEAVHLIDGAADAFYAPPYTPKQFAWQNYLNSTLAAAPDGAEALVYVLQMPSTEQAKGLYTALLDKGDYAGRSDGWSTPTPAMGTESRIQDDNTKWWINFYQGVFYVEVKVDPSAPPPDYTPSNPDTKKEAIKFAQAIASKL